MTVPIAQRPFTVAEYYRMAEAGILSEEDRVELLEGKIVNMSPVGSRHAACVRRLDALFGRGVGLVAQVSVQNPIRLDDLSEPEPDLALLRPREDFYAQEHPGPADVLLVVEVADTSGDHDRSAKVPLYSRAGIPEVWLVDLSENLVEMYAAPQGGSYRDFRQARPGESVTPRSLPDLTIPIDAVLG